MLVYQGGMSLFSMISPNNIDIIGTQTELNPPFPFFIRYNSEILLVDVEPASIPFIFPFFDCQSNMFHYFSWW